jgi:predicted flap endonuclease-1-like 5' DNA nuclease
MAMWEVFYRRWFDLAFWWLPKKERPPQEEKAAPARAPRPEGAARPDARAAPARPESAAPAPGPEPAARSAAPKKPVAPPVPDDLTVIKGIGPAVQNKLRGLGITTFADLAAADPDAILRQLKGSQPLTRGRVQAWTEAARERARP